MIYSTVEDVLKNSYSPSLSTFASSYSVSLTLVSGL